MNKGFIEGFMKIATGSSSNITMNTRTMGQSNRGSAFSAPSKPKKNPPKIDMGAKNLGKNVKTPMTSY